MLNEATFQDGRSNSQKAALLNIFVRCPAPFMIKIIHMCQTEKTGVLEVFFITNIKTLGNNKILTLFLLLKIRC